MNRPLCDNEPMTYLGRTYIGPFSQLATKANAELWQCGSCGRIRIIEDEEK